MKVKNLKKLIKYILLESDKSSKVNEMIANKDSEPDFFGPVNVGENKVAMSDPTHDQMYAYLKSAYGDQEGFNDEAEMAIYWFAHFYHGGQSSNLYKALSTSPYRPGPMAKGPQKNTTEEIMYRALEARYGSRTNEDIEEQSASGAAGAFSTPMAFRKRKIRESSFIDKVKAKLNNVEEKTTPDGRYVDDMLDGGRMKRAEGLKENDEEPASYNDLAEVVANDMELLKLMGKSGLTEEDLNSNSLKFFKFILTNLNLIKSKGGFDYVKNPKDLEVDWHYSNRNDIEMDEVTSSGAVFSGGPVIATPAWGTKNKLGSPGAIKATKKLGYKVAKSITTEEEK